jgi:hypothetical protein
MGRQKELTNPDDSDGTINGSTALFLLKAEKVTTSMAYLYERRFGSVRVSHNKRLKSYRTYTASSRKA